MLGHVFTLTSKDASHIPTMLLVNSQQASSSSVCYHLLIDPLLILSPPGMHTKLCVALAAANIRPGVEWLRKQQLALASCLAMGNAGEAAGTQVCWAWGVGPAGTRCAGRL